MFSIPTGYTRLEPQPGLLLLVRRGLEPRMEQAGLTRFPTPPLAAAPEPGPAAGRAAAWRMVVDDGPPLVIKRYRRGGVLGRIRGDRYLGVSRQMEEIRVCEAAHAAGLRVPVIQCLWIQQAGRFSSRLAAATREIPGARDLFRAFENGLDSVAHGRLLTATADAVRKIHDAGIHHPDLNLGNILVAGSGGEVQIHLIDFDRACLRNHPLNSGERNGALARMYRSLVKLSLPGQSPLTGEEKELFLSAYWREKAGSHTALRRRCRRELALHRLWWRLNPPQAEG